MVKLVARVYTENGFEEWLREETLFAVHPIDERVYESNDS